MEDRARVGARPSSGAGAVSHTRGGRGISAALLACVAAIALAPSCKIAHQGPSRGASADPVAAADATRRKEWRDAADRWYAVYLAHPKASAQPVVEIARALLMLSDAESANNILDLGLKDHPDDPDLLEMKADALVSMRFCRPAEEYYQRVVDKDPKRKHALEHLARVRIELGFEKAAIEPAQRWIAIEGSTYANQSLLARALTGAGDRNGAFVAWKKAIGLGDARLEDLLSASALAVDPEVKRHNSDALDVGRGWLSSAIALDPQSTCAHFQLGVLEEEAGAPDAAVEHYRRAVETDPACLMALKNLAVMYSTRGDEPKAREMVTRALDLEQDTDRKKALLKLLEPFEKKALDTKLLEKKTAQ